MLFPVGWEALCLLAPWNIQCGPSEVSRNAFYSIKGYITRRPSSNEAFVQARLRAPSSCAFWAPMIVVEEMGWDDSCCMRNWHLQRSQLRAGQDLWVQEIQIGRDDLFYRHSGTGKWRWIVKIRFSIGMQTRSMSHVQIIWLLPRSDAARLCIVEALSLQRLWVDGLQASVFIVPRWQHQRLTPTRSTTPLITTHHRHCAISYTSLIVNLCIKSLILEMAQPEKNLRLVHAPESFCDVMVRANIALVNDRPEKAIHLYTEVLYKLSPAHVCAFLNRSMAYIQDGYYELAVTDAYRACITASELRKVLVPSLNSSFFIFQFELHGSGGEEFLHLACSKD